MFGFLLKTVVGAFFSSIFNGWIEKRQIARQASQKEKDDAAWQTIQDERQAIRIRNAAQNLPDTGPDSAADRLQHDFHR